MVQPVLLEGDGELGVDHRAQPVQHLLVILRVVLALAPASLALAGGLLTASSSGRGTPASQTRPTARTVCPSPCGRRWSTPWTSSTSPTPPPSRRGNHEDDNGYNDDNDDDDDDDRYVVSTGGDYDSALGKSVPGFSIYHFGLDLVAVVSTGDDVWELKVDTTVNMI